MVGEFRPIGGGRDPEEAAGGDYQQRCGEKNDDEDRKIVCVALHIFDGCSHKHSQAGENDDEFDGAEGDDFLEFAHFNLQ